MLSLNKMTCSECRSNNLQQIDETKIVCLECGLIQNQEATTSCDNNLKWKNIKGSTQAFSFISITDSTEKRYASALHQITRICEKLNLQEDVCIKSAEILINLAKQRTLKRHTLSVLSVASVYAACRIFGKNFNLKHASDCSEQPSRKIKREYVFIIKTLNIKPGKIEPYEVLRGSKIRVDPNIVEKILKSYKKSRRVGGKSPRSLVAAASYIATQITGGNLSQREASNSLDVTERALRTSYKDMVKELAFNIKL